MMVFTSFMSKAVAALVGLAMVLSACGGDASTDESAAPTADAGAGAPDDAGTDDDADADDAPDADDAATDTAADPDPEPDPDPTPEPEATAEPVAARLLPQIAAETVGDGPRPVLRWDPVDSAERYTVVVLGTDGRPYWAWSGTETSVPMGGIDDPDVVGPWVHETMTWTVAATDAAGVAMGLSDPVTLTP